MKGGRASRNEYHLIDLGRGLSCGGFNSLAAARQCAREEKMVAWDIFHGNNLVERHDPQPIASVSGDLWQLSSAVRHCHKADDSPHRKNKMTRQTAKIRSI
jgi:hypothetical protein